jgi:NAD(P)-dependent dehydrogenase (short-subunit alcohol dehydrogenase family)
MRLDGKVALITGAGSGQGKAAARLFAERGAAVTVAEINAENGAATAEEVRQAGGKCLAVTCDVSQADQVKDAIDQTVAEFGRFDILYNNAGLWYAARGNYRPGITDAPSPLLEENIWDRTIAVNLKGIYLTCKYGIPAMQQSGDGGSIINTSSIAALRVGRGASDAYTAAKGGVLALTRVLAVEHAQYGIRCNAIVPGAVRTPLVGEITPEYDAIVVNTIPMGRWGEPADLAKMALFLASDDSSWVTGGTFVVDGGFTAV